MTGEWIHGVLEATFPLETSIVDADCTDAETLAELLLALDRVRELAERITALFRKEGRLKPPPNEDPGEVAEVGTGAGGSRDAQRRPTEAEVAEQLQSAIKAGAPLSDASTADRISEPAQVLGVELWEAVCWRRAALRYYMAAAAVRAVLGDPSSGEGTADLHATNQRNGGAARPLCRLLEDAHAALSLLFAARREPEAPAGFAPVRTRQGCLTALQYGIFSTTHLLALAFDGEICYYRWAASLIHDAEEGAPANVEGGPSPPPPPPAAAARGASGDLDWHARAALRVHRYLHTVDVLMEGCGWDTAKSRELLRLLSTKPEALARALQGEVGVAEREMARLRLESGAGLGGDASGAAQAHGHGGSAGAGPGNSAGTHRGKGGGKKGKHRSKH
jgi:hypothetical protein